MKDLLGVRQDIMEKVLALVLLACGITLLGGERFQDALFGGVEEGNRREIIRSNLGASRWGKWRRYSGVFVLLKVYRPIPAQVRAAVVRRS